MTLRANKQAGKAVNYMHRLIREVILRYHGARRVAANNTSPNTSCVRATTLVGDVEPISQLFYHPARLRVKRRTRRIRTERTHVGLNDM